MTPLEIITGISLISFVILVFFLIRVLIRAERAMDHMNPKVDHLANSFAKTLNELNGLISQCHSITGRIDNQVADLDPMFNTINKVGSLCEDKFHSVKSFDSQESDVEQDGHLKIKIANYLTLADICVQIIKQFKKGR